MKRDIIEYEANCRIEELQDGFGLTLQEIKEIAGMVIATVEGKQVSFSEAQDRELETLMLQIEDSCGATDKEIVKIAQEIIEICEHPEQFKRQPAAQEAQ